ncbi:MAG: type II and III secretion system protein family protein [Burkholderiaceae bacterium]
MKRLTSFPRAGTKPLAAIILAAFAISAQAAGKEITVSESGQRAFVQSQVGSDVAPSMNLTVGKSTLIRLNAPISRISVGNPAVADVTLINNRELYLLGKGFGSTNIMLWRKGGGTTIIDVAVAADAGALQARLNQLLPAETGISVSAAADSLVLSGVVSSASAAAQAVQIAQAFISAYSRSMKLRAQGQNIDVQQQQLSSKGGDGATVVNLMSISEPQQVMLEVKVAEISKVLLDKLGAGLNVNRSSGSWRYGIVSNLLADGASSLNALKNTGDSISIDAESREGLVKVLAEPNIVSVSGQEASFLAGGKIFIPVARTNAALGVPTITLEEKEFGVGLKFTPTVLSSGRINLQVAPEVSELSQTGSPFTALDGTTTILPSFTTRRAQTTVQLGDGQSFAIAGLIKNNVNSTIKKLPILGDIPVLGALFRSTEFQSDRTELMFIITPRLVKPSVGDYVVPTDHYIAPSRAEFMGAGMLEGSGRQGLPADRPSRAPQRPSAALNTQTEDFYLN